MDSSLWRPVAAIASWLTGWLVTWINTEHDACLLQETEAELLVSSGFKQPLIVCKRGKDLNRDQLYSSYQQCPFFTLLRNKISEITQSQVVFYNQYCFYLFPDFTASPGEVHVEVFSGGNLWSEWEIEVRAPILRNLTLGQALSCLITAGWPSSDKTRFYEPSPRCREHKGRKRSAGTTLIGLEACLVLGANEASGRRRGRTHN